MRRRAHHPDTDSPWKLGHLAGRGTRRHRLSDRRKQGAEIIVRMAEIGPDGPIGGYFDVNGTLPW
jgi:hypothetical protein